jgi:hypothetical protein
VVHACSLSAWEAEAGGLKFTTRLDYTASSRPAKLSYIMRSCFKKKKKVLWGRSFNEELVDYLLELRTTEAEKKFSET